MLAATDSSIYSFSDAAPRPRPPRRVLSSASAPSDELEWVEALSGARLLAANLTFEEKSALVRGMGWKDWHPEEGMYVGNIPAIPRLGIPSITMQDGPQGFRTNDGRLVGTVTAWPSQLAVGATWDPTLAYEYARAIGEEFRAKGANVVLGPGLNLGRVARNGRFAEYLSGEEPLLGAALGGAYVRGVQSVGVAASAKHFVANSQEAMRERIDSRISSARCARSTTRHSKGRYARGGLHHVLLQSGEWRARVWQCQGAS